MDRKKLSVRISGHFLSEIRDVQRRVEARDGYRGGLGENISVDYEWDNRTVETGQLDPISHTLATHLYCITSLLYYRFINCNHSFMLH